MTRVIAMVLAAVVASTAGSSARGSNTLFSSHLATTIRRVSAKAHRVIALTAQDTVVLLVKDAKSGIHSPLRAVATDSSRFRELWAQVTAGYGAQRPKVPEINFRAEMVIVAAMGPSPGEIIVDSVVPNGGSLVVFERLVVPGPTCGIPADNYWPASIVRVAADSRPPVFHDTLITVSCGPRR
jgi:hypothetical protein